MSQIRVVELQTEKVGFEVVQYLANLSFSAVNNRGKFVIALSGGSLPKYLTSVLEIIPEYSWSHWHVFFADERIVPIDHRDSNYAACQRILSRIPPHQIYPLPLIDTENDLKDPSELARRYEGLIRQTCDLDDKSQLPIFDLIMLGMGPDGHTASLFPQHSLSYVSSSNVDQAEGDAFRDKAVAFLTDSPKPPPQRITLTLDTINSSRHIIFVVTGENKAGVISKCFTLGNERVEPDPSSGYPCSFIRPKTKDATLTWYLDIPAASQLRESFSTLPSNYQIPPSNESGLPYFVYGTLIKGFRNHRVVEPYLEKACVGTIRGASLLHFSKAGFPGIYAADQSCQVKGELCFIKPEYENEATEALDGLEGFYGEGNANNLYDKRVVDVESGEFGVRKAFAYWCSISQDKAVLEWGGVPIEDENPDDSPGVVSWKHHMLSKGLESAGGDWHEQVTGAAAIE